MYSNIDLSMMRLMYACVLVCIFDYLPLFLLLLSSNFVLYVCDLVTVCVGVRKDGREVVIENLSGKRQSPL